MMIEESRLKFEFPDRSRAVKFDNTDFYRKYINKAPNTKGIDFLVDDKKRLVFLEVKNCKGDESNNNWRVVPNNRKHDTSKTTVTVEDRDSLDIEVAEKVRQTIAALVGVQSLKNTRKAAEEISIFAEALMSEKILDDSKEILVILFLEGDFGCQTRSKKAIMKGLQDSLNVKMQWLKCRVSVVDSDTYDDSLFMVS